MPDISLTIQRAMEKEGVSVQELADKSGVNRRTTYRILAKENYKQIAVLESIFKSLNISLQIASGKKERKS